KCGSEHLARVEIDDDIRPGVIFFGRKIIGRAAGNSAARGFGGGARDTVPATAGDDLGAALERAARIELELDRDFQRLAVKRAGGNVPAALDLAAQRVHLALRQLRA